MNKQSMSHVFLMSMLLLGGSLSLRAAAPAPKEEGFWTRWGKSAERFTGLFGDYGRIRNGYDQVKKDGEDIEEKLNELKNEDRNLWDSVVYSPWLKRACLGAAGFLALAAKATYNTEEPSPMNNLGSMMSGFAAVVFGSVGLYLVNEYPSDKKPVTKLEELAQKRVRFNKASEEFRAASRDTEEEIENALNDMDEKAADMAEQLNEIRRTKNERARNARGGNARARNARARNAATRKRSR